MVCCLLSSPPLHSLVSADADPSSDLSDPTDEWLDFEYFMDVRYHYMMGYGNPISPYLGIPWVRTAAHLLAGDEAHDEPSDTPDSIMKGPKQKPLPSPKLPPNATHSQRESRFPAPPR
jgi:hypothetical protein